MKISRRNFLRIGVYGSMAITGSYSVFIESEWINIKSLNLRRDRKEGLPYFVHITDIHYKGNASYLRKVVQQVNDIEPEFVCFTGDLVENKKYLKEALTILLELNSPLYGVPGNHEYWSGSSFEIIGEAFEKTGGCWLVNKQILIQKKYLIVGIDGMRHNALEEELMYEDFIWGKRILLNHYPAFIDGIENKKFDIILAGHSHGGQVRIPFIGALILPSGVGKYEKGLFNTEAGPLYVNPGIGTYAYPIRFNCRPEITVITI